MVKTILLSLLALLVVAVGAVLLVAAGSEPDKYISRSIRITAPIETVFAQVNDLENWNTWSPWKAMDPGMEIEYGPSRVGAGAWYRWSGEKAGEGRLTITRSVPHESVETSIDFGSMGMGSGSWRFSGNDGAVDVTWGFTSHGRHLLDKVFHLFLDGMLGPQFESGLAALKDSAESASSTGDG